MRQTIAGLIAGVAFAATMATAPAQACAVVDPCGYSSYGYGYGYNNYNYGYGVRARLARPDFYQRYASPQYYLVNQGPTYTGPGAFAPVPVYQERAVLAPQYYHGRRYRYGYRHAHYHRGHVHRYHHGQRVLRYKY